MSTQIFNLSGLTNIYAEALNQDDHTLIFDINIGRGRFLFMMFFSDEDIESKDKLFIFLRNTHQIIKLKLYGSHKSGDFKIYIDDLTKEKLITELQLENTGGQFSFDRFLNELNNRIPKTLPLRDKVTLIRNNWNELKNHGFSNIVDEKEKTVLIGEKRVPLPNKPQEKTLRKLYLYTEGDPEDVAELINLLKSVNMTVCWTTPDERRNPADIREMINRIKNN